MQPTEKSFRAQHPHINTLSYIVLRASVFYNFAGT